MKKIYSITYFLLVFLQFAAFIEVKAQAVDPNGNIYYVRQALPWGQTQANVLNAAFGAGNYIVSDYSIAPGTLLSNSTGIIYLEGSDNTNPLSLLNFLNANRVALEDWVYRGGRLFLNAAPNQGGNINFGFGGIILEYTSITFTATHTPAANITSGQESHTIFNTLPTGTSWTGGYFGHAIISGGSFTSLITGTDYGSYVGIVLGEKKYGAGLVLLGGMTTVNYHNPQPAATNLRINILSYLKSFIGVPVNAISTSVGTTSICANTNVSVDYTATGTYNHGNTFTAQLSDASGSFASPTIIGSVSSTTSGNINATIPAGTAPGTGYRIKIVASDPAVTGTDNGSNITIKVQPSVTPPANISVSADAGKCGANVSFAASGVGTISYSHAPGSLFSIGTTTVTTTATNDCGSTSNTFTVTVNDTEAPVIVGENSNITMNFDAGSGAPLSYTEAGITFLSLYESGSHVHLGDNNGDGSPDILNHSGCCSTPYRLTVGAGVQFSLVTMEVKSVTSPGTFYVYPSGASVTISSPGLYTFPAGFVNVTEVRWDQADGDMVIDNMIVSTETTGTCPSNIVKQADAGQCGAVVNFGATAKDNCSATVSYSHQPGSVFPVGTTVVTVTATDLAGNSSSCNFSVKVEDKEVPNFTTSPTNITINCDASTDPNVNTALGKALASDNCTTSPAINYTDVSTKGTDNTQASFYNYSITRTWTAEDAATNKSIHVQTITVQDVTPPTAVCKSISVNLGLDGTVSITSAQINDGSSDNCSPVGLGLNKTSFNTTNVGANNVTLTVTDVSGNSSTCTAVVTVLKRPTTLVYTGDAAEQYSDQQVLTAVLTDQLTGTVLENKNIGFVLGAQSVSDATDAAGLASANMILTQNPAPVYTVESSFAGDAIYEQSSDSDPFDITQEDARAYYTGALFASTSGVTSSTATVTLSATIKDITAVAGDPAYDAFAGDIRKATVSFINRETNTVIATVPVGLVSAGDLLTGTATANVSLSTGSGDSKQFTIGIRVNNYYTRNAADDNTLVTVSKPLNDFITGGGYINLQSSAGQKAGTAGTKNNFGFNVKYNKRGTNLQGNINTIFRRLEGDGILHVYQIKGNAMTSLSTNTSNAAAKTAVFNGKANMQDITNPLAPLSMGGNLTLQVNITDKGEPGNTDMIGITVWSGDGGMLYSSNWNGTKTIQQVLGGGNLKVSGGSFSSGGTPTVTQSEKLAPAKFSMQGELLTIKASPNPTRHQFTVLFQSDSKEAVTLMVTDVAGKLIEIRSGLPGNGSLYLGNKYRPGAYYVTALQNGKKVTIKLVKLSE